MHMHMLLNPQPGGLQPVWPVARLQEEIDYAHETKALAGHYHVKS